MTIDHDQSGTQPLRDFVAQRIDQHWRTFAASHPHLAGAIDRVRLVDVTLDRLRSDPRFIEAMEQANLNEAQLAAVLRVFDQLERWVDRLILR